MADQCQEHLPDDGRFPRGSWGWIEAGLARATLGGTACRVAGAIDPDARHALATQRLPPHCGEQERMHGHVQQGLQFLVRACGGGLAHQAQHGGTQGAVAGEVDVAQGHEPVAVEAQRAAVGVVAAVVVVAAQMADLLEVLEGGGARSIAERGLELLERDRSRGSQERGQHVGGAASHNRIVYIIWPNISIQYGNMVAQEPQNRGNRHDSGGNGPSGAQKTEQYTEHQCLQL